jgi:hypothetical protein
MLYDFKLKILIPQTLPIRSLPEPYDVTHNYGWKTLEIDTSGHSRVASLLLMKPFVNSLSHSETEP